MDTKETQAASGNTTPTRADIRSIAIIAHVDHGKTTLVDGLLKQTGTFRDNETVAVCVMDSNDLERERGITITTKNTLVTYKDVTINIIDTPGHADFGGEVERILNMVDGAVLLVAANSGPMPQTRFVLRKALERGLKPIVVINKIDSQNADPDNALMKVLELFDELGATEEQLDFAYAFAAGREGYAKLELADENKDLSPLLDLILERCPPPSGDPDAPLQMQPAILDYSDFVGRMGIGVVKNGTVRVGQEVVVLKNNGTERGKITKILSFKGLKRIDVQEAVAGEIVAIAGLPNLNVGDTIAASDKTPALPRINVDEPTLKMAFMVNDSPFAGREGKFVTSRQLRERLFRELETNVSLRVQDTDDTSVFTVNGRGELHLGIVIEKMRREGYELAVARPQVIMKTIDGIECEPFEKLVVDVPTEHVGAVMSLLGTRRADMVDMQSRGEHTLLEFVVPTRGLLGFQSRFIKDTKGTGTLGYSFLDFRPFCGAIETRTSGVLTAWETGKATEYALEQFQSRGEFFIGPGTEVYGGMIVGQNSHAQDLGVNVCKEKKLTNVRTTASEGLSTLSPPSTKDLQQCIEFIGDDELIEVTPKSIRMRKRDLPRR